MAQTPNNIRAMDSWNNGRDDLLQQLTKVCDQIGNNLQAELEDENVVRINREELRLLRENSANVGRFAESNARLSDELENCRAAVVGRVDELKKENKRLATELQQSLTRQEEAAVPQAPITDRPTQKSTPLPNEPPSSVAHIECDETKPVSLEKYQRLVKKWNALADCFQDTKVARQTFEDRYRVEVEKNKEWNTFKEKLDKSLVKKKEKIKSLEAEVLTLKEQLQKKETGGTAAGTIAALTAPAAMFVQASKETSREQSSIEIPASSPIKGSAAPMMMEDDEEEEESPMDERMEDIITADAEPVELPKHRANVRLVEETQFDALEPHHSSSTEGETLKEAIGEEAFDPDLLRNSPPEAPVVILSRSTRKRKSTHEPTEATPMRHVKVELISSSPIRFSHFLPVNESLDLDDIGEKVDTPRKHRQLQLASQRLSKNIEANDGQYQRTPVHRTSLSSNGTALRRTSSVLQSRSTNQQILPRTSDDRAPKNRRNASNKEIDTVMEDGELATPSKKKMGVLGVGERLIDLLSKPSPQRQALSPAYSHPNEQLNPSLLRTATSGLAVETTRLPPQESDSRGALAREYFNATSKDGLRSTPTSRPTSKYFATGQSNSSKPLSNDLSQSSAEPSRPVSRSSKDGPTGLQKTSKSPVRNFTKPVTPITAIFSDAVSASYVPGLPPRRDLQAIFTPKPIVSKASISLSAHKPPNNIASALKVGRTKMNMTSEEWELDPDQEPLRVRPVYKLRLSDFKINKNYNQGEDYAFRDVVRGHARNNLEACTKPGCCGDKFRKLAELTIVESPTISQEERDDELLRKFMGDNAYKLPNLSEAERHELFLQAKTRDLSFNLGRHRHAYARQSSPPGFWRTDFPTTQEEMEDQKKAKEIERLAVLERYNEAMRPGGRFIFKDE